MTGSLFDEGIGPEQKTNQKWGVLFFSSNGLFKKKSTGNKRTVPGDCEARSQGKKNENEKSKPVVFKPAPIREGEIKKGEGKGGG